MLLKSAHELVAGTRYAQIMMAMWRAVAKPTCECWMTGKKKCGCKDGRECGEVGPFDAIGIGATRGDSKKNSYTKIANKLEEACTANGCDNPQGKVAAQCYCTQKPA